MELTAAQPTNNVETSELRTKSTPLEGDGSNGLNDCTRKSRQCYALVRIAGLIITSLLQIFWLISPYWLSLTATEMNFHFIPATERFFESARIAPSQICVVYTEAVPYDYAPVVRNFTLLGPQDPIEIQLLKAQLKSLDFGNVVESGDGEFSDDLKLLMFLHWIRDEIEAFARLKAQWQEQAKKRNRYRNALPNGEVVALDATDLEKLLEEKPEGTAIFQGKLSDGTLSAHYMSPDELVELMFPDWYDMSGVVELLYLYWRAMDLPVYVRDQHGNYVYLRPPTPEDDDQHNYQYIKRETCQTTMEYADCKVPAFILLSTVCLSIFFALPSAASIFYKEFKNTKPGHHIWFPSIFLISALVLVAISFYGAVCIEWCSVPNELYSEDLELKLGYYSVVLGPLAAFGIISILTFELILSYMQWKHPQVNVPHKAPEPENYWIEI